MRFCLRGVDMHYKHGMYGSKLHFLRLGMIKRCYHKKYQGYKWYGGRGIRICDEWLESPKSFFEWALQNGYKEGLVIDRKDVHGNYTPENCQFITHAENCAPDKRRIRITNRSGERNIMPTVHGTFETYGYRKGCKQKFLGTYKTIDEAIAARNIYERIHDNPELLEANNA